MNTTDYTPEQRREAKVNELAERAFEELQGAEYLAPAVSRALGHDDWTGDVDPITSVQFDEALKGVLVCLIGNGFDERLMEGQRVRLTFDVERYPHFIAEAGRIGTVTEATRDLVLVKLDEHLPGAEDWDNCVAWTPENDPADSGVGRRDRLSAVTAALDEIEVVG